MNPPADEGAELAVLGGMSVWPDRVPWVLGILEASDFYVPRHQRWFLAIKALRQRGEPIEISGIISELGKLGEEDARFIIEAMATTAEHHPQAGVRVITEMSLRRRLQSEALHLQSAAVDLTLDPGSVLDDARSSLAGIDTPLAGAEPDDEDVDDFLARSLGAPTPWIVDGLLREGWRTVVVAREGQGKTWLLRQFAMCAAYGIHPLRFFPIPPISTLLVDLENPEDHLYQSLSLLAKQVKKTSENQSPVRLWRRPGGINLRKRADRSEIETLLMRRRPQLLVMGPLYKSYRVSSGDSWDLVASEVQGVLDDWRARFDLTILIEDHAPKGHDLVPFGSSLWLRWPEIGIALRLERGGDLGVGRWRGDRMPTDWPESLRRGSPWPWEGLWPAGRFTEQLEYEEAPF